ncbi:MAG: transglutaminase-like domain-containing protein, partial [Bacillota bacterium]
MLRTALKKLKQYRFVVLVVTLFVLHMTLSAGYYTAHAFDKHNLESRVQKSSAKHQRQEKSNLNRLQEKIKKVFLVLKENNGNKDNKKLLQLKEEIKDLDDKIKDELAQTEANLKEKGVAKKVLERNQQFNKHYKQNVEKLIQGLTAITEANYNSVREDEVKELKSIIEEKWLQKEFNPFKNNDFPDKDVNLDPGEPGEYESINPAYQYNQQSSSNDFRIQSRPDDLQETIEIEFTPEIKELARQLDNDPVKIYEHVRNNFDYEPYYGSVKGAQQTLWQKSGNDFDQASLLMALYRESDIPTRYVSGTVTVPIEKIKNWVGIEDAKTALNALSSGGIPTTGLTQGGKIAYAKLEHTWVEAKVSLKDYAGITTEETGKTWVALDPSFKEYQKVEGVELEDEVPFDAEGLMEELKSEADIGDGGDSVTNIDQELIKQKFEEHQNQLK